MVPKWCALPVLAIAVVDKLLGGSMILLTGFARLQEVAMGGPVLLVDFPHPQLAC
jgi:hypothetical protein